MRSTHTYALIEVPQELFDNVAAQFKALGSDYAHVFMRDDNAIDMHGYAITPKKDPQPKVDHARLLANCVEALAQMRDEGNLALTPRGEHFFSIANAALHNYKNDTGDKVTASHEQKIPTDWKVVSISRSAMDDVLIRENLTCEEAKTIASDLNEELRQGFIDHNVVATQRYHAVKLSYVLQKYPLTTTVTDTSKWMREDYAKADAETIKGFARSFLGQDRDGTHSDIFQYGMAIGRGEYPYVKFREYSDAYFLISGGITIQELLLKGDVDTDWSADRNDK